MKFSFYNTRHYSRCIQIIQSNTPEFIHPDEHREYEKFLHAEKTYYVLSLNSKIVACGGIWVNADQSKSGLSWGLVDRQYHGMGIGKKLLIYRLNQIKEKYPRSTIRCETSQHTYKFFEKFGFNTVKISKNGFAKGMDKYIMIKAHDQ